MTSWRREPILYFLGASVSVFAWYGLLQLNPTPRRPEIRISAGAIARLEAQHVRMWQRPPSAEELDALIDNAVRTEVLAREAAAMGLDRDDTFIRRQLRLRIEALADDATVRPAGDEELREYFEAHRQGFRSPSRYTFDQICLTPGVTLLEPSIAGADERDVVARFGTSFAEALRRMPIGTWQGPVTSAYGAHLVRLVERSDPAAPAFEDVRDAVAREWVAAQARLNKERFYESLRREYLVTLDERVTEPGR
jgi:hypothetical protein